MAPDSPDSAPKRRIRPVRPPRWGDPTTLGLLLSLAVATINVATPSAIGIGLFALAPLLAAARGASIGRTGALAALSVTLALGDGLVEDFFGEQRHIGPLITVVLAGLLAIYLTRLRVQRDSGHMPLQVQYVVARILQESSGLEEATPRLLEAVGRPLGWEVGGLWEVRLPHVLRCVDTWYAPGIDPSGFDKLGRSFVVRAGVGLPGRVWESAAPVWVADVTSDQDFPRAQLAAKAGLRGAVGFPLRTSTGVVGVMEFFARETREPDRALLDLLAALGAQIGKFVEVQSAVGALRESEARKGAMFETALDCIVTIDHEGTVVEFNPAAERTFGISREEAVGREIAELIVPPDLRRSHREALARFVETQQATILGRRIELRGMRSGGEEFPIELAINRIGDGSPPMFTGYIRDITERRRGEEDRERLLELERLARLDADRAREQLSAILRGVADAVTAQAPDGSLVFANDAAVQALGAASLEELLESPVDAIRNRFEMYDESGEPFPHWRLPGRLALRGDPEPEAVIRRVSCTTGEERWTKIKATPILGEGGEVVMAINIMEDVSDLKRAEQAQRLLARTLQESLLPARLPDIPGMEAAARFRASGEGNEVGGDFYDLFESGGGNWSVVIGDVCGKGPDAAAVTGLVRYTLRAAAMREPRPSTVLRLLNEALLRQRDDLRFATVAYASLTPEGGGGMSVNLSCAGHPLPLLMRSGGAVETVGVPGTLMGVWADPRLEDASARLEPGDTLVLYTDGVTEARTNGGILGERRLREVLGACGGMDAEAIATRIEATALEIQHGEPRDDIAVVVLRASSVRPGV